jgi:acyl dehydratase
VSITRIDNIAALPDWVGKEVGVSDWFDVSQERINLFAEATEDRQWIHLDVERAENESPYRTTIAHGFLSLSLSSELLKRAIALGGVRLGINYGLNRVRFVSPVPAGARVRGRFTLMAIESIIGGVEATWSVVIEQEGGEKPCCVAEWIVRYLV